MSTEMEKNYDPKGMEDRLYKKWEEKKYFHAEVDESKTPFTIVIPPPNITGKLHMGHALDETMQDILIRFKRMQGYNVLWQPGTDHASIATEVRITDELKKEGIDKHELGREKFLERAWDWKKEYGGTIVGQLKKLGSSCDWDRERFTMDEGCNRAVKVERQKAKANAIAQRIQRETAPISQSNQELEEQIEMKYRENKVPFLARSQAISGLFIRKSLKDWIFTLVFAAVMLFLIPLFIILGMAAHPVGLAFVMFVYMLVIFGLYLYLLNHCFIKYSGINDEVDELRRQIRANDKTKQSISSRIKKDENEEGYHLEEYDNEIARLQGQMEETINQRQAALDQFESEMRSQIAADVTAEKQEETAAVEKRLEDARKAQVTLDNELAAMEAVIREEYEPIFGKDLLHKNKLDSLAQFCEDHPDLTTEEAVAQFRNTR